MGVKKKMTFNKVQMQMNDQSSTGNILTTVWACCSSDDIAIIAWNLAHPSTVGTLVGDELSNSIPKYDCYGYSDLVSHDFLPLFLLLFNLNFPHK